MYNPKLKQKEIKLRESFFYFENKEGMINKMKELQELIPDYAVNITPYIAHSGGMDDTIWYDYLEVDEDEFQENF